MQPACPTRFHDLLNLWAYEDGALVGVDLQFTKVYSVTPPDLQYYSASELAVFFQTTKNALHSLPDNVVLQFLVRSRSGDPDSLRKYRETVSTADETAEYIIGQKMAHYARLRLQRRKHYLFVTTYPDQSYLSRMQHSPFRMLKRDYKTLTRAIHESRIAGLNALAHEVSVQFQNAGIGLRELGEAETIELLYEHLNPSRAEYLDPQALTQETTLRAQLTFNAAEANFDNVYLDGYYHRAVNLHTRPAEVRFDMTRRMADSLKPDFDLTITVRSLNQIDAIKQLQGMATQAKAIGSANIFQKYHEAELKARHADELTEHVKETFQKLFTVSVCAVLRNPDLGQLTVDANSAVQSFRCIGEAEGVIDDMNHMGLYLAGLPNHSHLNSRTFLMHTDAVCQLMPVSASWTGCAEPKLIFPTDDDQILPLDLFDRELPAKHGLVIGSTGSGKSFTTNMILNSFYVESPQNHVVIIDVGGSYRKLCAMHGGEYLEIDLSDKYAFNPFPAREHSVLNAAPDKFEVEPDTLSFLTRLVQKMLNRKELSGREQVILGRTITSTYRNSPSNPPLLEFLVRELRNYKGEDDEDHERANAISKDLELWTTGQYGKMLNRSNSIQPSARMVVFDLQKLTEQADLQSVLFFLIQNVIYSKLADKSLRKMIVLDECWKLLSADSVSVKLVIDLYKTARKFNAMILSISQSPSDFLASPAAAAMIDNSYTKYILPLEGGHGLLSDFKLTDSEIEQLKGLRSEKGAYREVFVKFGKHRRIIRIAPSNTDYWICTTDADDFVVENKIRQENPVFTPIQLIQALSQIGRINGAGRS